MTYRDSNTGSHGDNHVDNKSGNTVFAPRTRMIIVAVALLLLLPSVAGVFSDHRARQNWEKRELAALPHVADARSAKAFFGGLEAFINDHIGFATPLNRLYRQFQYYVFRDSPVPNVDVGDDGFVFFNSHTVDRPHSAIRRLCVPNARQVQRTDAAMSVVASIVRDRGARMTFAIVPSKPLLYGERLPATVPSRLREACTTLDPAMSAAGQLGAMATPDDYQVVFPFEALYARRDQPAYYPPGNFHAASMMNHEFAAILLESMGIQAGTGFSEGARLESVRADLGIMGFNREVEAWSYPYADYGVEFEHRQPAWIREYYAKVRDFGRFVTARPASDRSALLLSNSFGKYLAPHVAPGFKTLQHVNLNALASPEAKRLLQELLTRLQPDDVIYLVHDGGLPSAQLYMLAKDATL